MTKSSKKSHTITSLETITSYEAGITQASAFRLIKKITDASLQEYELTTMQWFMIGLIYDSGADGISVTELSQALGTNLPYVTNTLNVLVGRNIIMRASPEDNGRLKLLRINTDFAPTIATIEANVRSELRKKIYAHVTYEELVTYIRVLYKFNSLR